MRAARQVAVCGAGYTGETLARVLVALGKEVVVTDSRPADQLTASAARLAELGVPLCAGGHDAAVLSRANLIVLSPGVARATPAVQAAAAAGVPVWGEVELASRLTEARLVGITGTKGKSTTAALTSAMLDVPLANSEAYDAKGVPLVELAMRQPNLDLVVVELSSYQLEAIVDLKPWVATLLNVASDHTERHPTPESYLAAKARIFENQGPDDRSVYNLDDPRVREVGRALSTLTAAFSLRERPALGVWLDDDGIQVLLPRAVGALEGQLLARDAIAPALRVQQPSLLAAVATALMAEADPGRVIEVVRTFAGLPHRMAVVRTWRERTFVNDSKATNPLATANAIAQSPAPVVLIAGGLTKGIDLSPLVEPFRRLRGLVLIGQDAPKLAEVAAQADQPPRFADSLAEAVEQALEVSQPGDWIVLSPCGASFDMFRDFADRGEQFEALVRAL